MTIVISLPCWHGENNDRRYDFLLSSSPLLCCFLWDSFDEMMVLFTIIKQMWWPFWKQTIQIKINHADASCECIVANRDKPLSNAMHENHTQYSA